MPRTSSNRSFQNSKEWVDTAIQIAGSKQAGTYEAAYWIANHLLRFYRDSVHQWGMQQRRCFRTVQNPLVCAMSREKASFRYTHPDVLAQVKATDEENKRKLSEKNEVDIKRKKQREEGRIKALEYFEESSKGEKLTWVEIIFDHVKGGVKGMAFPPQFQRNQAQWVSPTMCRGRGMIWNWRKGVTGAAVEDDMSSRHGLPLVANKKSDVF